MPAGIPAHLDPPILFSREVFLCRIFPEKSFYIERIESSVRRANCGAKVSKIGRISFAVSYLRLRGFRMKYLRTHTCRKPMIQGELFPETGRGLPHM